MMLLLRISRFLREMSFHQHTINILIRIPFAILMDSICSLSKNHCCDTIILCYHDITFMAETDQFKVHSICSGSYRHYLTVIRI